MRNIHESSLKQVSLLTENRQYSAALETLNSVLKQEPDWFKPHHEKAKIYARQKLWDEAVEAVDEAIRLNPKEPMLYFSRARWLVQKQRFLEAYDDLTKLISLENQLGDAYYLESAFFFRALASCYLGNYEDVLSDCANVREDYSIYILNKPHSKLGLVELASQALAK